MKKIEAYQASDGQLFATARECRDYEFMPLWTPRVEAFLASEDNPYKNPAQITVIRKALYAWEEHKSRN